MNLAIETVLSHLQRIGTSYTGESGQQQVTALCPFHSDTKPSFGINLDTGEWNCLAGCGGGWIDTLLLRLGYTTSQVKNLTGGIARPEKPTKLRAHFLDQKRGGAEQTIPEGILATFYGKHPSMTDNWPKELLHKFEIGWDRGAERITFPIRDIHSKLVAISGRVPYANVWPKYKFYTSSDLYGYVSEAYHPKRSNLIYNIHRAVLTVQRGELVPICEGFKEVMRLDEAGIVGVSLTGAMCSRNQVRMLNTLVFRTGCVLVVMLDNDKTGRQEAPKLCRWLSKFTTPRIAFTDEVKDVSEVNDLKTINRVVRKAKTYFEWTLNEL